MTESPAPIPRSERPEPRRDPTTNRELFWQNVVAQMLSTLSVMGQSERSGAGPQPHDMLDGRFAAITRQGMRIPIARVDPLFACTINTSPGERALSSDVQCTVFRIMTPGNEMYTLPLHEITGIHAMSPEMLRQLEQASERQSSPRGLSGDQPFGFAAFTSLARQRQEESDDLYYPAPPGFDPQSPVN